ncbi:MAG TPA: LTA synthase family protein [Verrucomicrobiae bacterium]|nr:LTA synthase family protein [Verrucomicrobiae bacterium]
MSESSAIPVRPGTAGVLAGGNRAIAASRASARRHPSSVLVWSWFFVVAGLLLVVKTSLIFTQGEGLYETLWRVGGLRWSWLNYFAFYCFISLGGIALTMLARDCQAEGVRTVRVVNGVVLVLGVFFIFLTFHNGDKNYIYPVLSRTLSWNSLGPYVANSLFFNPPFLAAWLFVYAGIYYFLARTGREQWMLFVTAAFGFVYGLIFLQDLLAHRNELFIADCIGAISLGMAWSVRRSHTQAKRLPAWSLFCLLGWTIFFEWALLRYDSDWHTNSAKYFLGLVAADFLLFSVATWLVRKSGNPCTWGWLLPFFVTGFFLLTDSNYPAAANHTHLICLAATFPRYLIADLFLVLLTAAAALLYRKWRPTASLWWIHVIGLALILVALIDMRLTQIMGVRLGWDILSFGDSPRMMLKMARPYLPGALAGVGALFVVYGLAVRGFRAWLVYAAPLDTSLEGAGAAARMSRRTGFRYVAALTIALGALGLAIAEPDKAQDQPVLRLVRTSSLWKRVAARPMPRDKFLSSAAALGLGNFNAPGPVSTGARRDLNVVVVFMESSYNKHLSLFGSPEESQPLLSKYKDRMEIFPNFFSAFTGSIHARFATFTSLYPVTDFHSFTQERVPVKSLFEVLHDQGYTCSMFYSSYFDYTNFRDFLKNRGLDEMYDADTMPGQRGTERVSWGLLEEETLTAIRAQLRKYSQNHQRFCLTYVPAAPHYPYDKIPKQFQKHKMEEFGDFTPLYLNELLYMDWVLASIVDELKDQGLLENTLVVITNDHGEMLGGKEGHLGHGWAVTPQLANTPLILMDPARSGFQINKTVGTQVDLLPTILDRLHIPVPPEELYEGLSLDAGPARAQRLGYLSSYKEFGIVSGDMVLLGDRERSSPSGIASTGAVFSITNEGAKTLFVQFPSADTNQVDAATATAPAMTNCQSQATRTSPACIPVDVLDFETREALMKRFDSFQENFLRNYSYYVKQIKGPAVAGR